MCIGGKDRRKKKRTEETMEGTMEQGKEGRNIGTTGGTMEQWSENEAESSPPLSILH